MGSFLTSIFVHDTFSPREFLELAQITEVVRCWCGSGPHVGIAPHCQKGDRFGSLWGQRAKCEPHTQGLSWSSLVPLLQRPPSVPAPGDSYGQVCSRPFGNWILSQFYNIMKCLDIRTPRGVDTRLDNNGVF